LKDIEVGDLVAVFGGEHGKETHVADSVSLCKVLVVGESDLIVESNSLYTSSCHIVPKKICKKMFLEPNILTEASILTPQIGDLVVAFKKGIGPGESEKTSGILYKITYRLGKPDMCDLLCGTEMTTVSWEKILVVRRNN
tara:strand:+ start:6264 stop:6683 length:420 start_codon:yes stop_codon:yes gene_type:complete